MLSSDNVLAKLNLAWNFLIHVLKVPFRQKGEGARDFLERFGQEGLSPWSVRDKERIASFSRCINCGLCDAACASVGVLPRQEFPGPSMLLTTLTRSFPRIDPPSWDLALCEGCRQCESFCPTRVPIVQALEFIREKSQGSARATVPG